MTDISKEAAQAASKLTALMEAKAKSDAAVVEQAKVLKAQLYGEIAKLREAREKLDTAKMSTDDRLKEKRRLSALIRELEGPPQAFFRKPGSETKMTVIPAKS